VSITSQTNKIIGTPDWYTLSECRLHTNGW